MNDHIDHTTRLYDNPDVAKLERRIADLEALAEERYVEIRTLRAQLAAACALIELNTKENSR